MASEARAARTAQERARRAAGGPGRVAIAMDGARNLVAAESALIAAEPAAVSAVTVSVDTVANVPLHGGGAIIIERVIRVVQVAHGLTLAHSGVVIAAFALSRNDAFVSHRAGDVIHGDADDRAFFERNNVPIDWGT